MNSHEALAMATAIVNVVKVGGISYEEGKDKCQPYFEIINQRGSEIARKYNRKYKPITYAGLFKMVFKMS